MNKQSQKFLATLLEKGGRSSNQKLLDSLGWREERYWKVQAELVQEGCIAKGRGRGGSVILLEDEAPQVTVAVEKIENKELKEELANERTREIDLYEGVLSYLKKTWGPSEAYDNFEVVNTSQLGRRKTGGTWSRPDLVLAGVKKFEYYPTTFFDLVTFEVKPPDAATVTGVFEALSHREGANRAYVVYIVGEDGWSGVGEAERILEIAEKYGVGVYVAEEADHFSKWELLLSADSAAVEPAKVDKFVRINFDDKTRTRIAKWFR